MQATSQLAEDMFLQSEAVDCNNAAFTAAHCCMGTFCNCEVLTFVSHTIQHTRVSWFLKGIMLCTTKVWHSMSAGFYVYKAHI